MNNIFKKRIDELGRIVIPKQIRDNFKINSYDQLDIFIKNEDIVIKKNVGIVQYKEKFDRLLIFLKDIFSCKVVILLDKKVISSNIDIEHLENVIINLKYNVIISVENNFYLKTNIIIDSNFLGDIIFINNKEFGNDMIKIKELKNIIIDLIK